MGGKNVIKMTLLKEVFERCKYKNVLTYIQSGNVIFEAEENDVRKITDKLESMLSKTFVYNAKLVVLSEEQLKKVVSNAPKDWKTNNNLRCYVAFTKAPTTPGELLKEVKLKEGVDSVKLGENLIYMTTLLSGISKSGFTKLVGTPVYQNITIRNFKTIVKILSLI